MHALKMNAVGLPKYGPHGVLVSGPHGVTRDRLLGAGARMAARLKAVVEAENDELAKQSAQSSKGG